MLKGLKCAQHPEIDAVSRCRKCSTGVCNTCDFHISAGVHFCPACIDSADDQKVSPRRKQLAIGSIFVAVYCTLLGIITFSGALYQAMGGAANAREIGLFVMYGVYIPSVIGTALASCAFERRLKNTNLIWIGLIWNGALTGLFIVMEVAARLTR